MIRLADLRRFAVARALFRPTTLARAIDRLGFVQADPIRAPARAQDLTLRHRVRNYRAGDLDRQYVALGIEEDFFINYGFMPRRVFALMHPRTVPWEWPAARKHRAQAIREFIAQKGEVHPDQVEDRFGHGNVQNYWGRSSKATTHLLQHMHYSSMLRVTRRENGVRLYAASDYAPVFDADRDARIDALVDVVVNLYAPLSASGLNVVVRRLRYAAPQWQRRLEHALKRAKGRLAYARVGNTDWYWPAGEDPAGVDTPTGVRLLAPFDPIVWDRDRFETLWAWRYRFEAYTPATKRIRGYYALPLLWDDRVIGWTNLSVVSGELRAELGYIAGVPRRGGFKRELDAELARMRTFLGLKG